jgi:hypothetical protein
MHVNEGMSGPKNHLKLHCVKRKAFIFSSDVRTGTKLPKYYQRAYKKYQK